MTLTSRDTVDADGTYCSGRPVFIKERNGPSSTTSNGRKLSDTQRTISTLFAFVGVSGRRDVTGDTCHSPGFALGEVPMRAGDICLGLSLKDDRYRAVLEDTPHDLVPDLLGALSQGRRLDCLLAPALPRVLDQIAGQRIFINESTYDALATFSRTVEDVGLTVVLVFNVWGFFEKPVYGCIPFFFHMFYP